MRDKESKETLRAIYEIMRKTKNKIVARYPDDKELIYSLEVGLQWLDQECLHTADKIEADLLV